MPELPEVEIHRRNLERWAVGRRIRDVVARDPRVLGGADPGVFVSAVRGRRVTGVERRGKQLLVLLDGGTGLASHLGMTGKWVHGTGDAAEPPQTRIILDLTGNHRLFYRDPRVFGRLRAGEADVLRDEIFGRLGPDPLTDRFTWQVLRDRVGGARRPIKSALLDQARIAGIGNIQANEALWLARVHPTLSADALDTPQWKRLETALLRSIRETIAHADADEIRYVEESGAPNPFRIHGRAGEPCPRCGTTLLRLDVGGRGTFVCPRCQG